MDKSYEEHSSLYEQFDIKETVIGGYQEAVDNF